jgi:hypothetical protein
MMGFICLREVHQTIVIPSHTLLAVIINGTSWCCLGMYCTTVPLFSAPVFVTHKQTSFRIFAELFAGASFNASFTDGLRVIAYLWPIQFNIWKASMSLRNLYLQISAPHQAPAHEPMLVTHFTEAKVGMHLTGSTYQGARVRVLAIQVVSWLLVRTSRPKRCVSGEGKQCDNRQQYDH